MYKTMLEDVKEIKKRLSTKGQDVDETVIRELLESFDPEHGVDKIEYIINMITDDQDSNFQKSSDIASITEIKSVTQHDIKEVPKLDVQNSSTEHACHETIDILSDSDDDRDFYYKTVDFDDIIVDTDTPDIDAVLVLSQDKKLLNQVMPDSSNNQIITTTTTTSNNIQSEVCIEESLEENNNVCMKSISYDKNRFSESPKPGCSKDPDDIFHEFETFCSFCNYDELQKDAKQIHSLLPTFDHNLIYQILCNNQFATNRIELTLWDLLPKERPIAQPLRKRRSSDDICSVMCKRNLNLPKKDKVDATFLKKNQACVKNQIKEVESRIKPFIFPTNSMDKIKRDVPGEAMENQACVKNQIKEVESRIKPFIFPTNSMDKIKRDVPGEAMENQACVKNQIKEVESRIKPFIFPTNSMDKIKRDVPGEVMDKIEVTVVKSKNREPTLLMDKTDKKKEDTAGKVTLDNTDNNINRSGPPISKVKLLNKLKSLVDTEVHLYEKELPVSSEVGSKNNELQSTKNSAIPHKMEASSSEDIAPAVHHVLRPARFTLDTNISIPAPSIPAPPIPVPPIPAPPIPASPIPALRIPVLPIPAPPIPVPPIPVPPILVPPILVPPIPAPSPASILASSLPVPIRRIPILAPPKLKNIPKNSPIAQFVNTMVHTCQDKNNTHVQCVTKVSNVSSSENNTSDANVAQSSDILAVTDSRNKTLSNVEAKLAANPDHTMAILPYAKPHELPRLNMNPYGFPCAVQSLEATMKNQRGGDMNTVQVCDTRDERKDCQSNDTEMNGSKKKQEDMPNVSHKEIILNEKARKIYYKLIPMFPCIKTDYIKRLCQRYVKEDSLYDETVLLQNLVEYLLNCDQEHPHIKNVAKPLLQQEDSKSYDVNEQYANLLGIFPEADPVYLREKAEQIYNDPEQIKQFVQSKLEKPDYPTRAEYLAKKKITEQQKQYTTDFQIQQFLEIFPDPFLHFEDAKRKCQFNPHGVDFLKHYFSKIRVNTLLSAYSQFRHNLSLTAKALETVNHDMKTKRYSTKMVLTEDIPLLQECAFIAHKVELRKYLDDQKVKEEKEFQKLKARGELLECQCCYDDECMPSKCSTCNDGHIFCNSCIVKSTDIILAEGKTHVYCLLSCGSEFPLFVLQRILSPTKFSILLCKRQEAEVMAAGVEGLVSCPFCHFASIPPPEDKVFKCLNPDCMKESCRLCKEINHIPLKCGEVKSDAARLFLEEKMTEALIRKCYRCGRTFFKEEGCNKMTCVCGAQMCYICDKPVTSYNHFQGQGAGRSNLCPLWTDDRLMNAKTVITVCNETMKHIKEKNPDVNINVDVLLPKIPPKTKGPHEDTAYAANVVPERANRIARQMP